jgi:hypothetical protein
MPSRLSSAATGGLRILSALLIVCSIFVSTEAMTSYVKLLLGESENRLQGNSGSTPFTKSYNARVSPTAGNSTGARSSNIIATFTPSDQSISFSNILIEAIDVDVTAAHIHMQCPDASRCDNAILYTICSPCPPRSGFGNRELIIPGFTVDIRQLNGNVATAVGLYQNMMYSNMLYYLDFHTDR